MTTKALYLYYKWQEISQDTRNTPVNMSHLNSVVVGAGHNAVVIKLHTRDTLSVSLKGPHMAVGAQPVPVQTVSLHKHLQGYQLLASLGIHTLLSYKLTHIIGYRVAQHPSTTHLLPVHRAVLMRALSQLLLVGRGGELPLPLLGQVPPQAVVGCQTVPFPGDTQGFSLVHQQGGYIVHTTPGLVWFLYLSCNTLDRKYQKSYIIFLNIVCQSPLITRFCKGNHLLILPQVSLMPFP